MFIADLLVELTLKFFKGIGRAIRVKQEAPEERHKAVEYTDAFLFGDEDQHSRR